MKIIAGKEVVALLGKAGLTEETPWEEFQEKVGLAPLLDESRFLATPGDARGGEFYLFRVGEFQGNRVVDQEAIVLHPFLEMGVDSQGVALDASTTAWRDLPFASPVKIAEVAVECALAGDGKKAMALLALLRDGYRPL